MIDADLHGKLSREGNNAHNRSEDLLTSTVFGLLRYIAPRIGMIALMRRARRAWHDPASQTAHCEPLATLWLDLTLAAQYHAIYWPRFGHWGQPDLLLVFRDAAGRAVHLVVVEAKLHSPKSGAAEDRTDGEIEDEMCEEDEQELSEVPWHPDQLFRYWAGLTEDAGFPPDVPRSVVYLTAHASPPLDDLGASLTARPDFQPTIRLGWLSWRDIWRVVHPITQQDPGCLAAVDLDRLLAHRGFKDLDGFRHAIPPLPDRSRFRRPPAWFTSLAAPAIEAAGHFWESK